MSVAAWLTAVALSLPAPVYPSDAQPETPDERTARVAMIAEVAAKESRDPLRWPGWRHKERALMLLVKAWYESGLFALEVHTGKKRGDGGKSVCLAQIHRGPWLDDELWKSLPGTSREATSRCFAVAYAMLTKAHCYCTPRAPPGEWVVASVYALYGTGRTCDPLESTLERAQRWRKLLGTHRG